VCHPPQSADATWLSRREGDPMITSVSALPRDDSLEVLSRQAMTRPLLSAAQEVSLARRIERGDMKAKDRMIESNLRLVFAIARSQRGRGVPYADLVQEGTIGLVRAVERFDYRRQVKFSTYAVWWIRQSMRDAIASSQVIRIPARANRQLAAVRRAEAELHGEARRSPSSDAIAARTGISTASVRELRATARVTASLDESAGEDNLPLGELVADETAVDPSERAIAHEAQQSVPAMLRLLPDRHREVLERRYGLGRGREQSHAEIGQWLGVGQECSRQIEREALHRLRAVAETSSSRYAALVA
jgi:RNA polymerase primary sigma factor